MSMDKDEEVLSGRAARRRWLFVLVTIPFLALMGSGIWFFMQRRRAALNTELVEQTTGAAFGCVASLRGDAPEEWGLERALEHMARMERVTRDAEGEDAAEERARFSRLAEDAARGCQALGDLMRQATQESSELYFAVPAKLAQPPDMDNPERWFRRVLPSSREESVELTRQIRAMAETINARRTERQLMYQELPIEGRGASELARVIELAPVPRERENVRTDVWPLAQHIVVLRRGMIPRVPCDLRYINRLSCYNEFLQHVSWEGDGSEPIALERPDRVTYWADFTPTPDGSLWAIGVGRRGRGLVGRYPPSETAPEVTSFPGRGVDAGATITAARGGRLTVRLTDGTLYEAQTEDVAFEEVEAATRPLIVDGTPSTTERSISLPDFGTLSLFGDEDFGWTSRLMGPDEDSEDILFRVIEAHRRVSDIVSLKSLPSGRVVALLRRFESSPDAIVISTDFGRSWVSEPPE